MNSITKTHSATSFSLEKCGYPSAFIKALMAKAGKADTALLVLAIDNLSMMIAGHGFANAEGVMSTIPALIQPMLPENTKIERVQRDQFAILIDGMNEEKMHLIAERMDNAVRLGSHQSEVGALYCIPVIAKTMLNDKTISAQEYLARMLALLTDATDDVMSDYETAEDLAALSRQHMETANILNLAIAEKRFRLAYQPIIDAKSGKIVHYEALLRLHSHDGKISSAGTLIPIAERMGMVHLLDEITLEMVVKELRYDPKVVMAFNVSNETTRSPSWIKKFRQYLTETPEIGARMICEITETSAHRDLKRAAMFCADVQAFGAEVALDDFGSGYTSFRQLKSLSVDMVKIDGSFIKDLTDNSDNRFFVKTLLDFTSGFGLKSVAEFVENGETAKMLMELGVDYLQGYYFGKPDNIRRWLDEGEYSRG